VDKKMVTNHHFAVFLNEIKDTLTVENLVIKKKGKILFYMGKSSESNEQIIFQHGRFHLRDTQFAANPVVRVTWYGASAYARHYGKRLLTESEWEYMTSKHLIPGKKPPEKKADKPQINNGQDSTGSQMHTHMMHMDSSLDNSKNQLNAPAIKEPGANFKEWGVENDTEKKNLYGTESKENISYPSLVVATSKYPGQQFKNFRYPWEAFENVGFRCAVSLENES
jgi:serine/threonine-protein kinase